jgi:hypothetical protein
MKKLYILLAVVLAAGACKKEPVSPPPVGTKEVLTSLKFYYLDGTYYQQFYEYDASGNLMRDEDRTSEGRLMSFRQYYYEKGKLKDVTLNSSTSKMAQYRYTYTDNKPTRFVYQEYKDGTIRNLYEQLYEYDESGLSRITVNNFDGSQSYYINLTWEGKNVKSQKIYVLPAGNLTDETIYEYDTAVNPLGKLGSLSVGNPRYNSVNNVTKITNTKASTGLVEEIISDFEYDSSNRPVKQYNRFKDGSKLHEQSYNY